MKQVSLCLLIKEEEGLITEVLLAMKKRGFGKDRWNGTGGKQDPEKGDKDVVDSGIRETEEEIAVKAKNPERVGVFDFYFPEDKKDFNQQVHLFIFREWEGEPKESEEMLPKWFKIKEIPYNKMWDDDKHWMPYILKGKKLKAKFVFDENDKVIEKVIDFVESV
jgi:8-oxo-dGTP pyrophosphatase MutT (NUDIX family)